MWSLVGESDYSSIADLLSLAIGGVKVVSGASMLEVCVVCLRVYIVIYKYAYREVKVASCFEELRV